MSALSRRYLTVVLITALFLVPLIQAPEAEAGGPLTMTYEYHFPEPYLDLTTPDRTYGIHGLRSDERGGVPVLPRSSLSLAVPAGHHLVGVKVTCSDPRTIEHLWTYPTNQAEISLDGEASYAYEYTGVPWEMSGSYVLEGIEVLGLDLHPLIWDERTGALSFIRDFTVTLTYEEGGEGFLGDMDRVRELVDNPEAVADARSETVTGRLPLGSYVHLIITSEDLSAPFTALAEWKGERSARGSVHDDIGSTVVLLEDILADSRFWGDPSSHAGTGNDTQTIVRNFIIAAHQEWGVEYVLIGGDDDVIPARMVKAPIYDRKYDKLAADIYYSGLDGNWDRDGDGIYGEVGTSGNPGSDEADLLAEVFVGRATVSTAVQAWNFVNKTIRYEMGYSNQYADDLLLIGELLDTMPTYGDDYKDEVYDLVLADEGLEHSTLYARDGTFSGNAVLQAMGSGVHVINHMGHGDFVSMVELGNDDIATLTNDLPFVLYTQACHVAGFDEKPDRPGDCIAEEFVQGEGGAVAFIGNSRYGWYSPGGTSGTSQKFDISFFSQVYDYEVTDLGRALSYSKEEWAAEAALSGTTRWVYLELNLLGDPETRVHLPGRALNDLAVEDVEAGRTVLGEPCQVEVAVRNVGQSECQGTVRLMVGGGEAGSAPVSLLPGERTIVTIEWMPSAVGVTEIAAMADCPEDQRPENDIAYGQAMVDRRIEADETWSGDVTLTSGFVISPGTVVTAEDCRMVLTPCDAPYILGVEGALVLRNCTIQGSPFSLQADGGYLDISDSLLTGMSATPNSSIYGGSASLRNTTVTGGAGWWVKGASVNISNVTLSDQQGEWTIVDCAVNVDRLCGHGGDGMRLLSTSGAVTDSSWTGGSAGLIIERCTGLTLQGLEMKGNAMDMGIFGETPSHFIHVVDDVNLTYGPLAVIVGAYGSVIENASGSLYLVGCENVTVMNSQFRGAGNGLALVDCSGFEVKWNAFEECAVGLMVMDSQGSVWGNDLLDNALQARQVRSSASFAKGYPVGGNHWSDMSGADDLGGADQDQAGADGMFDSPYRSEGFVDPYPKVSRSSYPFDRPTADFGVFPEEGNRVEAVSFISTGQSGIGIANWTWEFGDGGHGYGPSVEHTYSTLGTYTVTLLVTDHKGMTDQAVHEVEIVNLPPVSRFSLSPDDPLPGGNVTFQDLSHDPDGEIVSWHWDFGDGASSDGPAPVHAFLNEGIYLIALTVLDDEGGSDTCSILVPVGNDLPVADFAWNPLAVTTSTEVTFTSRSTDPDGQVVSWSWDFGDGTTANGPVAVHRYSSLGRFPVTLTVTDEDGGSASQTKTVLVSNSRPAAVFECPSETLSLLEVEFLDQSYDPDGNVTAWFWEFGDGGSSNETSPSHVFHRPGTFQINLTVTDDRGSQNKVSRSITVLNRPPAVNMTVPEGDHWSLDDLVFVASGHDEDGTVTSFTWDMGDGTVLAGETARHAYLIPGNYMVSLTAVDDSGGEAILSTNISVLNLVPRAEVRMERGNHPLEVVFIASAEDDDGVPSAFGWSFGDGTFGNGLSVSHRYALEGTYAVTLSVVDDLGGATEVVSEVMVRQVNVSLSDPHLEDVKGTGWVLLGEIVNQGDIPLNVTLVVNAGGMQFTAVRYVGGLSSAPITLVLKDFEGGEVNVTMQTPDDWDSDLQDNVWTGSAERAGTFPYLLIGAAMVLIVSAAIAALLIRRR